MAEGTSETGTNTVRSFSYSREDEGRFEPSLESTRRYTENGVCRFYLRGRCKFGSECWHSHHRVKYDTKSTQQNDTKSTQQNDTKSTQQNDRSSAGPSRHCPESRECCPSRLDFNKKDTYEPKYSFLQKKSTKNEDAKSKSKVQHPLDWVNAPEFVPKTVKSYADTLKSNMHYMDQPDEIPPLEICPYFVDGECPFENHCPYVHGDVCELCMKACLNPFDDDQRKMHIENCEKELEEDMELSFAIQRSLDKSCGICMDVILEKEPISERRFGILEKCNHVFCLSCIRKWRKVKTFEGNSHIDSVLDPVVTRACPECRIASDFITPSQYWVDTDEEKKKLIEDYKVALSKKHCKYFKQGKGSCPFGGACFYLHAKPDGTKVELPPPVRRRRQNQDGELDFMGRIFLWDYLELRDNDILMQLELDDFMYALSDSDDDTSEASDNFFLSESF
ncbi:probable E3 ubiquitin-protein ligase makorin-1 [Trichonephila clavipes]|nr:probable E3 ubiquitin-protein ligase makorin-1 [Trichonephila clavipes]